ncbi:MAG TPA: SDR family oxidoreductase [Candidatus Limnocylindria bacterium]|nr:SDR family oxidoreductase [Candidatus Limnocylindria bacterium]
MTKSLDGKVAIVTGAAGGIGRVYARALADEGAAVVIADMNGAGAADVAKSICDAGHKAAPATVDVSDAASAKAMVDVATKTFGGLDILVNNAGLMAAIPKGPLLDVPMEWFEKALKINALSMLVCAKAAVPAMLARGGGRIINQSSTASYEAGGLYRLTKHLVNGITAALAKELGAQGITVNGIAPGMIQTEEGFRSAGAPGSERRTARAAGVPNPRPDRLPEDLVMTLLLLASPGGDYINGQTIIVDGGRNIRL